MELNNIIEERIAEKKSGISVLSAEIRRLEKQKNSNRQGIEKWIDFEFQSSCSLTEEFTQFSKEFKKHIKDTLSGNFELSAFNRGHFYMSGFVKNIKSGKLAYFSTDDVRGCSNGWYNHFLIRTAKGVEDYTGGDNLFTSLISLESNLLKLTE